MAHEYRYILFSSEELCNALLYDIRACGRKLPSGLIKRVVLGGASGGSIYANLLCLTDSGQEMNLRVEQPNILRALIMYCGQRKIPLPVQAEKTLEIQSSRVALRCVVKPKTSRVRAAVETVVLTSDEESASRVI